MRIIYITSLKSKPYGGINVILRHSKLINTLDSSSYIFNNKKINFLQYFFNSIFSKKKINISEIKNLSDILMDDFVIIPEIHVPKYASYFFKRKIKIGILVQGPFLIKPSSLIFYKNASMILVTSLFINKYIKSMMPDLENIHYLKLSVKNINYQRSLKQKIIGYMPRKINSHSELFISFMNEFIPKSWKIVPIDNMTHLDVINFFSISSIFLSFSDLEGFGLPAIEAAVHGNIVIGYSAQGSKEYFKKPIFHEIEYGDFISFKNSLLKVIDIVDNKRNFSRSFESQVKSLKNTYSENREIKSLKLLIKEIKNIAS